jgi:hypothetical protein
MFIRRAEDGPIDEPLGVIECRGDGGQSPEVGYTELGFR